jgi:hypothetical protein
MKRIIHALYIILVMLPLGLKSQAPVPGGTSSIVALLTLQELMDLDWPQIGLCCKGDQFYLPGMGDQNIQGGTGWRILYFQTGNRR